jgi:hypothetical protein
MTGPRARACLSQYCCSSCPVPTSKSRQLPSSLPVPKCRSPANMCTVFTSLSWPWNVRCALAATLASHNLAVLSHDPEMNMLGLLELTDTLFVAHHPKCHTSHEGHISTKKKTAKKKKLKVPQLGSLVT